MTWEAFCERLFTQNRFTIKLGLDAMRRALALSGHPERHAPAILVAGTNGKGTTCACLAAILEAHGYTTGLFTSPHIIGLEERFRVGGVPVDRDEVIQHGLAVLDVFGVDDSSPRLTFFELTTLMAVRIFASHPEIDVCIYEVGLGGRLDATNAIEPSLSVVTTIGLDHMAYLGDTIEAIAREKLAISRPGVPLVVGAQEHERRVGALLDGYDDVVRPSAVDEIGFTVEDWGILRAPYQRAHFSTAVSAASLWMGRGLDPELVAQAISRVRWPGRLQKLVARVGGQDVEFLLDAAHNPDGSTMLFDLLDHIGFQPGLVLCGAMKDKVLRELFAPLDEQRCPVFGVLIENERAADEVLLREHLPEDARVGTISEAFAFLKDVAAEPSQLQKPSVLRVLVFGSIYLLGELLGELGVQPRELVVYAK